VLTQRLSNVIGEVLAHVFPGPTRGSANSRMSRVLEAEQIKYAYVASRTAYCRKDQPSAEAPDREAPNECGLLCETSPIKARSWTKLPGGPPAPAKIEWQAISGVADDL